MPSVIYFGTELKLTVACYYATFLFWLVPPDLVKQSVQCPELPVHLSATLSNFNLWSPNALSVTMATKDTNSSW